MAEVKCEKFTCKHNGMANTCSTQTMINEKGECISYEKGLFYYTNSLWNALGARNYIDLAKVDDSVKRGIYYINEIFGTEAIKSINEHGNIVKITKCGDTNGLTRTEIMSLAPDYNRSKQLIQEFDDSADIDLQIKVRIGLDEGDDIND